MADEISEGMPLLTVGDFSVKNIVKAKLWYEGVEIEKSSQNELNQHLNQVFLPEEITVALEKFDS
tara:strand:- start:7406 stop:7600 length:195 start_codon:yes stop_codon:yes gene_type:complete